MLCTKNNVQFSDTVTYQLIFYSIQGIKENYYRTCHSTKVHTYIYLVYFSNGKGTASHKIYRHVVLFFIERKEKGKYLTKI